MGNNVEKCELCGSDKNITCHHLIPQQVSRHKNNYLKNDESNYSWI